MSKIIDFITRKASVKVVVDRPEPQSTSSAIRPDYICLQDVKDQIDDALVKKANLNLDDWYLMHDFTYMADCTIDNRQIPGKGPQSIHPLYSGRFVVTLTHKQTCEYASFDLKYLLPNLFDDIPK